MYGISPKLPLIVDSLDGHYGLTKTIRETIKQNFKNLILTAPGERIMDLQFGVGLRNYFFENFTTEVGENIKFRILNQTKLYMPFIEINSIDVNQGQDKLSTLFVKINYSIPKLGANDNLILNEAT
jgi:phage baseplate assembly protein W|tara:strand:- start:1938 stop:2315 length:378 start_codon:yes stop_codon:yes gene_type:complete